MDIIKELQEMAFASRLKRLSERLLKDVSRLYHQLDIDFEARWFSVLYALNQQSPLAVTKLAQALGLTHTAVNQLAKEMIKYGLIEASKGKTDERQRLLYLTPKAKQVFTLLTPVWDEIHQVTKELIEATGCDILQGLSTIEALLDEQDMFERVWIRLKGQPPGEIVIREYRPALKKYFKALNYEWLEEYFEIEKSDEKILSDPNTKIIKNGGAIFFARLDEKVVGTCALIKHPDCVLELAKMAVTKKYQGRGIGGKLLNAVIVRAKELGATVLYLQTNRKLKPANHLYEKFGFRKTNQSPFDPSRYERPTYVMKLELINR